MTTAYQKKHAVLMKQLIAALPSAASALEKRFTELCYEKMLVTELEKLDAKKAVAVATNMFGYLKNRKPLEEKIRVFSPKDSYNTVVELLNDDMPFLLDSLTSELVHHGLVIKQTVHPIIPITRDKNGDIVSLGTPKDNFLESFIHFEISSLPEGLTEAQLQSDLEWVLAHIVLAVTDWKPMVAKAEAIAHSYQKSTHADVKEAHDFMTWLANKNFVFLGYSEYSTASNIAEHTLGILQKIEHDNYKQNGADAPLITITKSNRRSPVHRYVPMDTIIVKRVNEKDAVIGEACFVGLFTSNAYYQSVSTIPLVRAKIAEVQKLSGFGERSHDGKSLATILEFLPRDEMLQINGDDLLETAMGILALEVRPGVRVFVRKDASERFISAMVFIPRERFSTDLRKQIQDVMERSYNATTTSFTTQILDTPLARLHIILKTTPGDVPQVDLAKVEKDIVKLAYMWSDQLLDALVAAQDEQKALKLHRRYASAFPQSYINSHSAEAAVYDIEKCEMALVQNTLALDLYQDKQQTGITHLKIYNPNQEIALSDMLPLLENAGFRVIEEYPFELTPLGTEATVRIRDFKLELPAGANDIARSKQPLEALLLATWNGDIENDKFNGLVLKAGIDAREVIVLRAYAKYLKQIGFNASVSTIQQALLANPAVVILLVELFTTRFSADLEQRDVKLHAIKTNIEKSLEAVTNATEDRVLRRYMELVFATLRTNYYQPDRPILSFKMDSATVPELPLPRPFAEIFVYSPRVEGIHLRGGPVARGGLRWSDRIDDFRTEVLGLMKAQMVKNSVIVPVGSKGGFVVKLPPISGGRDAMMQEGIACYTLYLQGLLDITDNIVAGMVTPPKLVVRHDGDDPYLVVAADKGTATFSDIANSVSAEYGFWLGDAFASGGSVGYDHKKMAITARGGWVSVTRHFKEMGIDIAQEDFTCIGIGDMSGDVFGNGMLLSEHTKLVAAFNHLHIFIDPDPDAKTSFAERKRLFDLPRSGWKDYDSKLISKGGDIYDRTAKFITISDEAKQALGLAKNSFTPDELIRGILQAPVDLLWNGGIGTYVKASEETHEQVGDRTNNALRINGAELRCKVIGEGGNLGLTQLGRIEYAKTGGRINTDAIDNSAGVDCSDHEVNIKIAFSGEIAKNALTMEKRNQILESMTDEVGSLVLKDNVLQTLALTVAEQNASKTLEASTRLMYALEKKGLLNRAIEYLPSFKQLQDLITSGRGLSRPELAVLLAYSKMDVFSVLAHSESLNHAYFEDELLRYFPHHMRETFKPAIFAHPLKKEIIATVLTNSLVNRVGITFMNDMMEETGASVSDIAIAYALVRDTFGLRIYWETIDSLTGAIEPALQAELFSHIQQFAHQLVSWLLSHQPLPLDIDTIQASLLNPAKDMLQQHTSSKDISAWVQKKIPAPLANFISNMDHHAASFDMIQIAEQTGKKSDAIAETYFAFGERLQLNWLREALSQVNATSFWQRQALQGLLVDSYSEQRRFATNALKAGESLDGWSKKNADKLLRFDGFVESLKSSYTPDDAILSVLLRQIKAL